MKSKRESGEVVVEASIVVTLVMIIITIMMYVGMILYQQTLVSVMANQTASNIAQVYSNNLKDPFSGYVDPDKVYQSITYSNMKTDAYMSVVEQKANVFAQYRLKSSRILANGNTSVEVQVVKKPNELLKSQIVVTIRDHYDVPLVGMFGTSGLVEFASSGRADCVDVLEYVNGVEAIGDPENSNVSVLPDSKNCTVTFVPDSDNPGDFIVETVLKGHSIMSSGRYTHCVMPANPKKGDLEFAGWYTQSGGTFFATTQIDENVSVYGKWLCQITMDANGGTVNGNTTDSKKVAYGSRTSLPIPERAGYNFVGWFDANNVQYISNDTPITKNVTLKAKWERRTHTVTFDANGGTLPAGVNSIVTVNHNETAGMPKPKYVGKVFDGWYDSDGVKYDAHTIITKSVVLKAKWNSCNHEMGHCGVEHTVSVTLSREDHTYGSPRCYFGTTVASCIVCKHCGCWLDGSGFAVEPQVKRQYGSSDKISQYIWCVKHNEKGSWTGYQILEVRDNYLNAADAFYVTHQ